MRRNRLFFSMAAMALLAGLWGCAENEEDQNKSIKEEGIVSYSVSDYKDRIRKDRTELSDYEKQYAGDIEAVTGTEYEKLHFETAVFEELPDTDRLVLITPSTEEISVEDTIAETKHWLKNIGKEEEVNLETDLGVNLWGPEGELREGEPFISLNEWDVPLFYNRIDELTSGDGAVIWESDCYMGIDGTGMSQMSDGKVSAYLRGKGMADSMAGDIINMEGVGPLITSGSVEEFSETSYLLLDREVSVIEGAGIVENYYADMGTLEHPEGIRYEAADVEVYQLEDVCLYKYLVQRVYYNMPITRSEPGNYQYYSDYSLSGEGTMAYVADSESVTAFNGTPYNENLIPLLTEDSLIGMAEAVDILEENLAAQIDAEIDSVELTYLPLSFQPEEDVFETVIFPCWKFSGTNKIKDEQINLYVDVLTGDVYFYGYTPPDQSFDLNS